MVNVKRINVGIGADDRHSECDGYFFAMSAAAACERVKGLRVQPGYSQNATSLTGDGYKLVDVFRHKGASYS